MMERNIKEFVAILQHFGVFQPEEKYKIICPFHHDKNASMSINVPEAFFYCFGCGAKGSTFELFKYFCEIQNKKLSDIEIFKQIKKITRSSSTNNIIYNNIYNIYINNNITNTTNNINIAKDYYYNLPLVNWYSIKQNNDSYLVKEYMLNRGFNIKLLNTSKAKLTFDSNYPIIFPLLENGIFKGYVKRTINKEIEANRKYLYNKGFSRKTTLAGSYNFGEPIMLVEGYLDYLAARQLKYKNVAAILGWKISNEQLEIIKNNKTNKIICALDNDKAGENGYDYLISLSKKHKFAVEKFEYPDNCKDFGDILKNKRMR